MAKKLKRPAKKTEEPGEFTSVFDRVRRVFIENWRLFTIGIVLVVLIVVGVMLWMRNQQRREAHASFLLSQGVTALKAADGLTGEEANSSYDETLRILRDLVEGYGSTESGRLGLFFVGKCLARLKRYEEAALQYEEFLSISKSNPLYRALAIQSLGFAYESGMAYEKALACFSELAQMEGSFLRGESILALARIYEEMGQREKALEAYREFLTDYPDSTESNRIQRRVALLEKQFQ